MTKTEVVAAFETHRAQLDLVDELPTDTQAQRKLASIRETTAEAGRDAVAKLPDDADRELIVAAVTAIKVAAQKKLDAIKPPVVDTPTSKLQAEIAECDILLSMIAA